MVILQRKRATLVVISVSIIYAICWVPVLVMYTVTHTLPNQELYSRFHRVTILLAMFNSCINPVVYSFTSARFRKQFLRLLRCTRTAKGQLASFHKKQQEKPIVYLWEFTKKKSKERLILLLFCYSNELMARRLKFQVANRCHFTWAESQTLYHI